MELDISFDILPILPQIEDFTISSRRYHGEYIQHLNPLRLHRLFIYVLGEHSAYLDVAKRLGGADSALQELVLEIPGTTHNQMATILPFFPCLTHLSLHVFSWDTVFLTYLPVLAPGLRTLSMRAVDSIVLHNQWRGTILKVQKPYGFCESLACEIATMKCELWKGWTLESVEFSVTSDERLSLAPAATAFAERLPNCRAVTRKGQD
ncbi:hypothetical protein DL96DRAFT_1628804 [Flagelloscypha sp. PMI_526]|nr:hypothetical protein DL96DRAFT_1628804 [Flagelloscypha sp. PMI_526]